MISSDIFSGIFGGDVAMDKSMYEYMRQMKKEMQWDVCNDVPSQKQAPPLPVSKPEEPKPDLTLLLLEDIK